MQPAGKGTGGLSVAQQTAATAATARPGGSLSAAVGAGGVVGEAQRVALLPRVDHPLQAAGRERMGGHKWGDG